MFATAVDRLRAWSESNGKDGNATSHRKSDLLIRPIAVVEVLGHDRGEGILDAMIVIVVERSGFGRLLHEIPDLPSSYGAIIRRVLP